MRGTARFVLLAGVTVCPALAFMCPSLVKVYERHQNNLCKYADLHVAVEPVRPSSPLSGGFDMHGRGAWVWAKRGSVIRLQSHTGADGGRSGEVQTHTMQGPAASPPIKMRKSPDIKTISILFVGELLLGLLAFPIGTWLGVNPLGTLKLVGFAKAVGLSLVLLLPTLALHPLAGREINELLRSSLVDVFGTHPDWRAAIVIALALSASAGIGEELLFRGTLQPLMAAKWGASAGVLASSLVFGVLHAATPRYFLLASALSVYLGFIQVRTGNLLIPVLVHAFFDVVGFLRHAKLLDRLLGKKKEGEGSSRPTPPAY